MGGSTDGSLVAVGLSRGDMRGECRFLSFFFLVTRKQREKSSEPSRLVPRTAASVVLDRAALVPAMRTPAAARRRGSAARTGAIAATWRRRPGWGIALGRRLPHCFLRPPRRRGSRKGAAEAGVGGGAAFAGRKTPEHTKWRREAGESPVVPCLLFDRREQRAKPVPRPQEPDDQGRRHRGRHRPWGLARASHVAMVKAYLRYELTKTFGVITSGETPHRGYKGAGWLRERSCRSGHSHARS